MTVLFRALRRLIARRARVSAIVLASAFALVRFTAVAQGLHRGLHQETGHTYYVAPYGDDSNPGTIDQPWASPKKAGDTAVAGDTVYFRGGTYEVNGISATAPHGLWPKNSGTADAWIRFMAYPNEEPIIRDTAYYGKPIYINNKDIAGFGGNAYIEINGLTGIAAGTNGAGITTHNVHHINIINCTARASGTSGINTLNGADHVLIAHNRVYGNSHTGVYNGSGISVWNAGCFFASLGSAACIQINDGAPGYHNFVTNNIIYDNYVDPDLSGVTPTDGNGIIIDNTGRYNPPTLISNNVIFGNGGACIHLLNSWHVDIVNNTCFQNVQTARLYELHRAEISLQANFALTDQWGQVGSIDDVDVINNIAYSRAGGYPFGIAAGQPDYRTDYNLWFNGVMPNSPGANDILDQAPLFLNPALDSLIADFRLGPASPATDSGTNEFAAVVASDFDGNSRPHGQGFDMGAYESQRGEPVPTATSTPSSTPTPTATPTLTPTPTVTHLPDYREFVPMVPI